jgi:raffinose/stachyose/melibiose transport system substrate-binding protein
MKQFRSTRAGALTAFAAIGALALSACSAGSLGSSDDSSSGGAATTISFLVDNSEQTMATGKALADGFNASQKDVQVKIESRPQGADGDNLVKTKLATGEMSDVFQYNSGSLLAALDPPKNMVDISGEAFKSNLDPTFVQSASVDGKLFGVPYGQAMGGGILYNKKVFADNGLTVPTTWAEFEANNDKLKAAGVTPVIQSYGDTWTSQLFVLADFHNVTAQQSDWATKYTENQAHYVDQPALTGFQRLQEGHDKGWFNKDFASTKLDQALTKLVKGEGAQYPMLTFAISAYTGLDPTAAENIGFFAQPGNDASTNALTAWTPAGAYIPKSTTGAKLEAAKKFLAWIATPAACDAQTKAVPPTGPYMVNGCDLPDGLPTAVTDLKKYFDDKDNSLALEFLSPIKGPNLEKITVEVGSGIRPAQEGAKLYDQDVKKQAQQLGLPGWN